MQTNGNTNMKKCNGHCKTCLMLGACPSDSIHCDTCGCEIEPGEEIEVETEIVEHGRHYKMNVPVCRECYEQFYLSDNLEDLFF